MKNVYLALKLLALGIAGYRLVEAFRQGEIKADVKDVQSIIDVIVAGK